MEKFIKKYTEEIGGENIPVIEILGIRFREHDKRGFSTNAIITLDFAKEIIKNIPCALGARGRILYPERLRSKDVKLSWDTFTSGEFILKIHDCSDHVYTSEKNIV